jgi:hypothetical protein
MIGLYNATGVANAFGRIAATAITGWSQVKCAAIADEAYDAHPSSITSEKPSLKPAQPRLFQSLLAVGTLRMFER